MVTASPPSTSLRAIRGERRGHELVGLTRTEVVEGPHPQDRGLRPSQAWRARKSAATFDAA